MNGLTTIGIVGSGDLGADVAQISLQAGLEVVMVDDTEEALGRAEDRILRSLHRAEQPGVFSLLRKATRLDRLETCDLVLECATEDPAHTMDLLRRIDARLPREAVLAVQTAALPVRVTARAVENPDRMVGLHFFQPARHSKLIELVHYEHAGEPALARAREFATKIGKTVVRCKDTPGFVANRVARPFYLAALRFLEAGRGTPGGLDGALKRLGGFAAGPFELLDFFGLEEDYAVAEIVYQMLGQPERLKPSALQHQMILRGCRGRRNGKGFYLYEDAAPGTANPLLAELTGDARGEPVKPGEALDAVLEAVFREAHALVDEGVAAAEDVDRAMKLGLLWPKGPFEWEKEKRR